MEKQETLREKAIRLKNEKIEADKKKAEIAKQKRLKRLEEKKKKELELEKLKEKEDVKTIVNSSPDIENLLKVFEKRIEDLEKQLDSKSDLDFVLAGNSAKVIYNSNLNRLKGKPSLLAHLDILKKYFKF